MCGAVELDFPRAEVTINGGVVTFSFRCTSSQVDTVSAELTALVECELTGAICDIEVFNVPDEVLCKLEPLYSRKVPSGAKTFASVDFEAARLWLHLSLGPPASAARQRRRLVVETVAGECRIAV